MAYNLCWQAQAATAKAVSDGASEIEVFTTAHSVAQLAFGEPVEFVADVLAGPNAAQVCCPVAIRRYEDCRASASASSRT